MSFLAGAGLAASALFGANEALNVSDKYLGTDISGAKGRAARGGGLMARMQALEMMDLTEEEMMQKFLGDQVDSYAKSSPSQSQLGNSLSAEDAAFLDRMIASNREQLARISEPSIPSYAELMAMGGQMA